MQKQGLDLICDTIPPQKPLICPFPSHLMRLSKTIEFVYNAEKNEAIVEILFL